MSLVFHAIPSCVILSNYKRDIQLKQSVVHYYLGVTKGALADYDRAVAETKQTLTALRKEGAVRKQFEKLQAWWEKHLNVLQCEIPDADA